MTCMFVGMAPEAAVKKITTRLFTNRMAIFITKKNVKYMVQILYLVPFRQKSGASLQNIAQAYVRTVGRLSELDLRVKLLKLFIMLLDCMAMFIRTFTVEQIITSMIMYVSCQCHMI